MDQRAGTTDGRPRLLGVYAHPDDEIFCAGGTFARYAATGAETMVMSATRGDAGQIRDATAATRRTVAQVRERELRLSCERLGVRQVACLDYGDGRLAVADRTRLVGDVVRIIRDFRPDAVFSFGPDGGYGHPDHIAISEATSAACRQAGDPSCYPEHLAEGLSPHQSAKLYYATFPSRRVQLLDRLVEWLVEQQTRFAGTVDFIHALLLMAEEATMLRFTNDHYEVKWYPTGSYVIEQGEAATELYLILSGHADVCREGDDGALTFLERLGPGIFFGETGIANRAPRNAHVVAAESLTCLIFSPVEPSKFAGRGEEAHLTGQHAGEALAEDDPGAATVCIDVADQIDHKIDALAAYRTQFPLEPGLLPASLLTELMGREYFTQVQPPRRLETELF